MGLRKSQTISVPKDETCKALLKNCMDKLSKEEIRELEEYVHHLSPDSKIQEKESLKEKVLSFMNRYG